MLQFGPNNDVISKKKKKGFHRNFNGFSGQKWVISKKKGLPEILTVFRPKLGDLQKKKKGLHCHLSQRPAWSQ